MQSFPLFLFFGHSDCVIKLTSLHDKTKFKVNPEINEQKFNTWLRFDLAFTESKYLKTTVRGCCRIGT